MSGALGQRALFANAPVLPAPASIPTVPPGSNLAAAMMGQSRPMNLPTPGLNLPPGALASMANMLKGTPNPTPGNNQSALTVNPDGSISGTPGQPPQPQTLSWANGGVPQQGLAPGMPGQGAPGMPSMGAVGMPGAGAVGTPSMGSVGTPSAGQPGLFGQTMNWLQNLYGGGGSG